MGHFPGQTLYELDVSLPSLEGKCRLAVLDRLPRYTFLLGTDFGREKLLDLLSHIKSSTAPALAVTQAMAASDELAEKTAQSLQLQGPSPVALEDIAEVVESESTLLYRLHLTLQITSHLLIPFQIQILSLAFLP